MSTILVEHEVVEFEISVDVAQLMQFADCVEHTPEGEDDKIEVLLSISSIRNFSEFGEQICEVPAVVLHHEQAVGVGFSDL